MKTEEGVSSVLPAKDATDSIHQRVGPTDNATHRSSRVRTSHPHRLHEIMRITSNLTENYLPERCVTKHLKGQGGAI